MKPCHTDLRNERVERRGDLENPRKMNVILLYASGGGNLNMKRVFVLESLTLQFGPVYIKSYYLYF
jgi:hypothetical protein